MAIAVPKLFLKRKKKDRKTNDYKKCMIKKMKGKVVGINESFKIFFHPVSQKLYTIYQSYIQINIHKK